MTDYLICVINEIFCLLEYKCSVCMIRYLATWCAEDLL